MSAALKLTGLLAVSLLCLPIASQADDTQTPATQATHRAHKAKKTLPPPLPSGPQGPVPQVPLDAMPAVAPQVSYTDGLLTIVAPNSTLGDILRSVRKHTAADIDVPTTANERVVTRLGPAPAREVVAELLNGSRFNYILLGSPGNSNSLVRVVLVAKTGPDNPEPTPGQNAANTPQEPAAVAADAAETEAADEAAEDAADQQTPAEGEQPAADQPGIKTPQQMLQEMQQRQLQMQQQQQQQQQLQNGQTPVYPPPGGVPQRPPQQQQDQ